MELILITLALSTFVGGFISAIIFATKDESSFDVFIRILCIPLVTTMVAILVIFVTKLIKYYMGLM